MSAVPDRTVSEPSELVFDEEIDTLRVRIAGGGVNIVGTEESVSRLEISELDGPPLIVSLRDGILTVAYEDLPWKDLLKWLDRQRWKRRAVVSLTVPHRTGVEVGVIGAGAVVSGISGPTTVQGVNGDITLVGLTGPVRTNTVAGGIEAQAVSGDLRVTTVSGDLTVVEGSGSHLGADSVSGAMMLDLDPSAGAEVCLTTVSGEIAIRIPETGDSQVDANTTSGAVSCSFDELKVTGRWGAKRLTGRIGSGAARLKATTVSGSIAILRRPPPDSGAEDVSALRKES